MYMYRSTSIFNENKSNHMTPVYIGVSYNELNVKVHLIYFKNRYRTEISHLILNVYDI